MSSQVYIVNYGPEYAERHFAFATKMFGDRRKRRNADYLYWKFRGKQNQELSSFKLAIIDGMIVGQFGQIPVEVNVDNQIIDAQWACDLVVDPDYRGKGVAKLLYDAAHKNKKLTLGSNPSPAAEISMLRSGYKKLKSSNKQFIPLNLGLPLRMKGVKVDFLDDVKNPFLKMYAAKKYSRKFKELDILKENHQELFQLNTKDQVFINRSEDFKEWRLTSFKDYYPDVKLYNLVNTKTYYSGYYNGKIYFITDLYLDNEADFSSVINHILGYIPHDAGRIRFQNNSNGKVLGSKLTTIKYGTETSIIYFTENKEIDNLLKDKYFYYTHQDSDENI
jgi:GNAT superfamily N-acetyltransferase